MQKSKLVPAARSAKKTMPPSRRDDMDDPEQELAQYEPAMEQYQVQTSRARRELTARDLRRNQQAETLFQNLIPGLPLDADPQELRQELEPFEDVLGNLLQRLQISETPWLEDLNKAWSTLMPPEVSRVARPGKLVNGVLYVYVASSIALHELRRMHLKEIERKICDYAGRERVHHVHLMINSVSL